MDISKVAPVRQYDGSREMRSLADGVAKLIELDDFSENETATIKSFGWSLGKGVDLGFPTLLGPVRNDRPRVAVHLPPCRTFSAKTTIGVRHTFGIALLHEAQIDAEGNVTLGWGEHVHSVEFVPDRSWRAWSPLDEAIVRCAIRLGKTEHVFCWPVDEALLPDLKVLRYDILSGWHIEGSRRLLRDITQHIPDVSLRRAASALKRAGFELDSEPANRGESVRAIAKQLRRHEATIHKRVKRLKISADASASLPLCERRTVVSLPTKPVHDDRS
jgi:hypothetical protein